MLEVTVETVGGLASSATDNSVLAVPTLPTASITRADSSFVPSLPQPEPEFMVIDTDPLSTSADFRT